MAWTEETVQSIGRARSMHFKDYLKRVDKAKRDSKKLTRQKARECRFCHYLVVGVSGQAFTIWTCVACGSEEMHPNTSVPKLCGKCADQFKACVRCGGSREWK